MSGLSLEHISHSYGERLVLDDVSLMVGAGEVVCLLGPSGCGKTTTLRLAAGLEHLQGGRIRIGEQVVAGEGRDVPPEARHVGLIFQDYALFPHLDIVHNVAFGLREGGTAERHRKARTALARVGLAHLADAYPHRLSGGEQQRVALARALAPHPALMLMDEPFSGLDIRLRDRVRDETLGILKESGAATLLVTHDPDEAMRMADRIAVMREGRIVQVGAPEDLYARPVDAGVALFFSEMNSFPGHVTGGFVPSPFGKIPAPHGAADGMRVEVLMRLHAFRPDPDGVPVRVLRARVLGPDTLIEGLVDPAGAAIQARLAGQVPVPADGMLRLVLDRAHAFAFPARGA
jgi:iron(III) transport system ATP-binding protein